MALTWVERVAAKHSETIRALEKLRLKNQPPPPPKNGKGKVNIDLLKKLGVLRAPARTFGLPDRRTQIEDNPFRARPPQIEPPFREPPLEEGDTNPFRRGRFPAGVSERVTAPSTLVRAPTGELKPPLGEARRFPSPSEIELLGANVEELPPPKRFRPPGEVVGELLETPPGQIATGVVSLAAIVMGVGIPAAQQSWRSLTNLALMRQISRWAMERNIAVSKDEAQVMANQMRNYATQKGFKWDLDKRVLRDIFKATDGRTVPTQEATRQAEETAQQVVNRFAPAIIPRGTQTGAMAFGGREVRLSKAIWDATPVAQRVAQAESAGLAGQVGSKAFEALTPAEKTALAQIIPEKPPLVAQPSQNWDRMSSSAKIKLIQSIPANERAKIGLTTEDANLPSKSLSPEKKTALAKVTAPVTPAPEVTKPAKSDIQGLRQEGTLANYNLQAQEEWLGKGTRYAIPVPKDGKLTIYRATPTGESIRAGDYVTSSKLYAQEHIRSNLGGKGKITSIEGTLDDLAPADAPNEFWYAPKSVIPKAEAGMPEAGLQPSMLLTRVIGRETTAYGPDPTKTYQMRYRLVELDDLIPSHTDAFAPNPAYPKELQPRIRERGTARLAVTKMARDLVPEVLIRDDNTLDRGPMIIGNDNVVESGNGRVMALRQAQQSYPERWQAYQKALQEALPQFGIDQAQLSQMRNPVLVRERISDVDRVQFAAEANQPAVAVFSPLENALQDARRIRLENLVVPEETQSIDTTLRMASNRPFVTSFLETLPANERVALLDANSELNLVGMQRIKAAMFARTYPGEAGRELTRIFFESREPIIRNIEDGMMASLPKMARAEELVRSKQREVDLGISEDLAKGLGMLATLKQRKLSVDLYLGQRQLFNRELTPFQERLLKYIEGIANSPRKVREFLGNYSDAVIASTRPEQVTMFKGIRPIKEELFNATIGREEEGAIFTQKAEFVAVPTRPASEPGLVSQAPDISQAQAPKPVIPQVIQPTEAGGRVVPPTQPPVPTGGEGGIRPPLTTLPPEPAPTPAVTAKPQAQRVPPIEPPPPTKPPTAKIPEPTPPSGRPRTLADLTREAKGMRALKPEERAAVMDIARPISEGELLYEVKPFEEHAKNLLGPDTPIKEALRSLPGVKQVVGLWTPAQMERDNPIAMIGVRKQIFEEIEIGRARLATLNWWHDAEDAFSFKQIKGKWRATNVESTSSADVSKPYHATIHDLVEHPENYNFTPEQQRVLQIAQDMQRQIMRDAQRAGVDAVELFNDYWRRIVIKAPSTKIDAKTRGRISQRKGYTRQRVFDFVDEGSKAGYEYETHPLTALQNRLEAGIRTISDQETRQAIAKLPGVEKPLERLESRYPQTVAGARQARQARDAAKTAFLRDKTVENETALRQAEADYIMAMKEIYAKKLEAGQPNIGELKLPNGRIAPAELVDEVRKWVDLPEIQTSRGTITNPMLQITRLVRTTLTNVDLAAGFIQGQVLFYRNNVAWMRGQFNTLVSLIDDPTAYVAKNFDAMDEGMRMGAISIPTEFLFTRQGLASIPTRIPIVGPAMKAFNRAFEWFILTGQTELYKAARGAAIRRAGGDVSSQKATDALVSLGSAIRKELGTESYAILGVRPTQHTAEQLLFFAARFFRALTGFQAQAFTGGEAGHEARRAWGSMLAGGLALTIAISYLKDREMPNLTDPFKPGWLSVKIGNTYFNAFGPYYSYLRTQARVGVYVSQGRFDEAAKQLNYFMQSKAGLPLRGIDMAAQFGVKGYYTTFEGKTLPKTPLGVTEAALGEFAVPISIQEALKSLPEGRPESAIAEVFGLVGRENYPYFPEEMLSTYFDIPSSAIELRAGKEDGTIEFSREEYREEFPPIDAMLFLKGYVTTIKTEEARQFVLDIVRREGYDPRQLRAVKKWQGEQDKLKELGLEDENITLTDSLIMELLGITTRAESSRGLPTRGLPERRLPERTLPSRGLPIR